MAGLSNAAENDVLNLLLKNTAWPNTAPLYMALVTTAVGEADTGASIVEATYTGYARKQFPTADWNAASGGSITTNVLEQFAACTGGTSTVIGWAMCTTAGTGTGVVVVFGTCTSVTINVSQQPAQVQSGGITVTAD